MDIEQGELINKHIRKIAQIDKFLTFCISGIILVGYHRNQIKRLNSEVYFFRKGRKSK